MELSHLNRITSAFFKKNSNIIFTRADKGNVTIALDKLDYIKRVEELLHDESTYTIINENPIKKHRKKSKRNHKELVRKGTNYETKVLAITFQRFNFTKSIWPPEDPQRKRSFQNYSIFHWYSFISISKIFTQHY